jgi:hypothetical protein
MISDSAVSKFRVSELSSARLSSGALLLDRATNAWAVRISVDDVSTLSSLGGVVRIMGTTADALPPGWSGHAESFAHRGYFIGDSRYGYVGHQ